MFQQNKIHKPRQTSGYADFSKAFDNVPRTRLSNKLHHYGIKGNIRRLIESFLKDRQLVVVNNATSYTAPVPSDVQHGRDCALIDVLLRGDILIDPNTMTRNMADVNVNKYAIPKFATSTKKRLYEYTVKDELLEIAHDHPYLDDEFGIPYSIIRTLKITAKVLK